MLFGLRPGLHHLQTPPTGTLIASPEICIYLYILEWTRALNAREVSWSRLKWPRASWIRKDLWSVRGIVLVVFWASGGILGPSWRLQAVFATLGRLLVCLLGRSWVPCGGPGPLPWASGAPLGGSWTSLGLPLGLFWAILCALGTFPGSHLAALGPLLAARSDLSRHLAKTLN